MQRLSACVFQTLNNLSTRVCVFWLCWCSLWGLLSWTGSNSLLSILVLIYHDLPNLVGTSKVQSLGLDSAFVFNTSKICNDLHYMDKLNKTVSPECLRLRSFTTPWKECVIHESGTVLAQASSTYKWASQPSRDEIHGLSVASGSTGIQDRSCKSASKGFLLLMHTAFSVASVFDTRQHLFLRKELCSLSSWSSSLSLLLSTGFIPGRLSFLLAFAPRPTRPVKCEMTDE